MWRPQTNQGPERITPPRQGKIVVNLSSEPCHVIQVYLNQPDLEFVWVGDDAVDPLQQAQTLNILVGAGIKTREEARADLGLAPEGGKDGGLGKFNPYHDERGRFTTAPGASSAATQVAADDAPPATQSSTRTQSPDDAASAPPDTPTPPRGLTIVQGVPDDAVSLKAGDGTPFYAPPHANFREVYAAGQANWQNPIAVYLAVGQFGTYDFQRDNGIFYSAYTNASNYAVGVYMSGAGYSYHATVAIGTIYASHFSSNAGAESQTTWWTKGWNDATNGAGPCSRPQHD